MMLLAFLCFPLNSFAVEACFDEEVAKQMIVAIEKSLVCEKQIVALVAGSVELQRQLDLKEETIKLQAEQIELHKTLSDIQKKVSEAKDQIHKEELKAAKPTFMDNLGKIAIGIGIGIVITVGVALAL
jgi:uncharacterized protein YlxW (UPF0749 family)